MRRILEGWGLKVEIGVHARDLSVTIWLAGMTTGSRISMMPCAILTFGRFLPREAAKVPTVSRGLDFEAARRNPKPLIGFSDITILHLAL
jgi:muramoyltetrapeptide carboxypeptidase